MEAWAIFEQEIANAKFTNAESVGVLILEG
jgi:hypothetical protein